MDDKWQPCIIPCVLGGNCSRCLININSLTLPYLLSDSEDVLPQKKRPPYRFQCQFCNKAFQTSFNVKKHERIHTGEKPYACEICGRRFSEKGNMKTHHFTHIVQKKF